jgi:Zn-dependent M16 (insulinase) family peptidase
MDAFIISLQSISTSEIYQNTMNYFRYVLFGTIFNDYKIILEECEKQLKNLIEKLQDGQTIHQAYFNSLLNSNDSSNYYHQMNIFVQKKFFEKICKQPEKYQKEIISKLQAIKFFILKNLSQMHLTICGNVELIKENWQIIEQFIQESHSKSQIEIENYPIKEMKDKHIPILSPGTIIGSQHEESG